MHLSDRPYRSVLYIPGSKQAALAKARSLPTDAVIFDLEDAIAPDEKPHARAILGQTLQKGAYGPRAQIVRINALNTPWGMDDIAAIAVLGPEAILLPKVNSPADIANLEQVLATIPAAAPTRIWAMMETPLSILNAATIATMPRVAGFVMGTNDLAKDLGTRTRTALATARQTCVLAARAHGIVCIDGVYNTFRDIDGLAKECAEGRDWGFDGKTLIHPAQIATANAAFSPSKADLDLARRYIAAYDTAVTQGHGIAVVDGTIVEALHIAQARATLAKAKAIARLEVT